MAIVTMGFRVDDSTVQPETVEITWDPTTNEVWLTGYGTVLREGGGRHRLPHPGKLQVTGAALTALRNFLIANLVPALKAANGL
jgi:hypothetical protein